MCTQPLGKYIHIPDNIIETLHRRIRCQKYAYLFSTSNKAHVFPKTSHETDPHMFVVYIMMIWREPYGDHVPRGTLPQQVSLFAYFARGCPIEIHSRAFELILILP